MHAAAVALAVTVWSAAASTRSRVTCVLSLSCLRRFAASSVQGWTKVCACPRFIAATGIRRAARLADVQHALLRFLRAQELLKTELEEKTYEAEDVKAWCASRRALCQHISSARDAPLPGPFTLCQAIECRVLSPRLVCLSLRRWASSESIE